MAAAKTARSAKNMAVFLLYIQFIIAYCRGKVKPAGGEGLCFTRLSTAVIMKENREVWP
jgi:hypothetical protein